MSAQLDLIDFFRLDATFNPTTRSTREAVQSSDRAQLKRKIVTMKEWKRQPEPIGHGRSGIIWLERDEDGKESRVVKQIRKATPTEPLETDYKRELQALGYLSKRQDLFVHFYGWFESDTSVFLAMEYFELGDLEKFITPKLAEKDAKMIGRQLLEGLQVLHGYHLAHRDLKPANIFVARCAPDWWIKLGDFGIARRICTEHNSKLSRIGTLAYMAPEILEEQNSPYTLAVDIWSLGCVLFRLLTQKLPFPQDKQLRLYWLSKKPFPTDILIKHNVSEDGVSLVSKMMTSNPADRMTVSTALLHSWVSLQESTPSPGYHDSLEANAGDELDNESANKGSDTENRNSIPVNVPKSNLEDDQTFFNAAIASHTGSRDIPHETPKLSPYNSHLSSLQNEEVVQLRKPISDAEEHIFDSTDKDTDTLEARSNLADSYLKLGLNIKAMQLFQQTLEARRRLLGDEHPDTLRATISVAESFTNLGRDQEALQLYQQTLEVQKRVLGDEHPNTLQSMNGLAVSYSTLGRDQDSMPLYKQTLELQKRLLGDEHPDTLQAMYNLAYSYHKIGRHQEALQLTQQSLEVRKRVLGEEHPDTLRSINNLINSYITLGRDREALQLSQQMLEVRKRVLGDGHPETLLTMSGLALSYTKIGRDQEAIHLHKQIIELRKRLLGDEHPDTLRSIYSLAFSYTKIGRNQEALQLTEQTLEIQKRVLGDEHPNTLHSMNNIADSYSKLGRDQEALQLNQQTLEVRKRVLGDGHPDTLWSMHGLAISYSNLGRDQEAMRLFKQTLDLRKRLLGDEHPDTHLSMNALAEFYSKLGRDQEAMQLNQQTPELRKRLLDDEHPDTLQSLENIAISYSKLGRDQEAMQLSKQPVEARRPSLGPTHPPPIPPAQELVRISRDKQANQKEKAQPKPPRKLSRYLQFLKR